MREVIIGSRPTEHYVFSLFSELKKYHQVQVKVRKTIDEPKTIIDNSFYPLLKRIAMKEIESCEGTIELIKYFQETAIFMERKNITLAPIFINRYEKAEYIVNFVLGFGVDLKRKEADRNIISRNGDSFVGTIYYLELWPKLFEEK